jgi:hydroxyacylglutathione hydrolase
MDRATPASTGASTGTRPIETVVIETPDLGDRSYLVHDGLVGVVVDPQRDIDRLVAAVAAAGVRVTHVLETHVHNDYISGGLALSRRLGAQYAMSGADDVSFERTPLDDGSEIETGALRVRAVATPGHTFTHLSYVVGPPDGAPQAVFTGGSLLFGSVGRTDLLGDEHLDDLTRAQYRSVHDLLEALPPDVEVHPTHGFGSFCSSGTVADRSRSTIGIENGDNIVVAAGSEDAFVEEILRGVDDYPTYYAHMGPLNLAGAFEPLLVPPAPIDAAELRTRLERGEWIVDLRRRVAFAADHLAGTVSVELGDSFVAYLGWLLPWGSRLTVIGPTAADVADAQRRLARIGLDHLSAVAGSLDEVAPGAPRADYPVADFEALARRRAAGADVVVLDVRRAGEWRSDRIAGSHNVPLHQLLDHLHHVPDGELWVHCESGLRSSIAASLLARAGYPVVLVNDDFENASTAGLTMASGS